MTGVSLSGPRDEIARSRDVIGRLHEAQRHVIHAEAEAEPQIVDVLSVSADGGSATPGALMPLWPPSGPPLTTTRSRPAALRPTTFSSIRPSSSNRRSPGCADRDELGVGGEDPAGLRRRVALAEDERLAFLEGSGAIAGERAGADLRSTQVLHDADVTAGIRAHLADAREGLGVRGVRRRARS